MLAASSDRNVLRLTMGSPPLGEHGAIAASAALREVIERRRVLDEDAVADLLVRYPVAQQIEQHRVVGEWRLGLLRRMWPIAPPHAAFRRGLGVSTRDGAGVRVGRRPHLGVRV